MSEQKYGYLYNPPDAKEWDEEYCEVLKGWIGSNQCSCPLPTRRRRLIQPGEGFEIVDKTAVDSWIASGVNAPRDWEATMDGITWKHFWPTFNAIRRPVKTVERVRYWTNSCASIYKSHTPFNIGFAWSDNTWIKQEASEWNKLMIQYQWPELTESEVIALIGREAIFGKEEPKTVEPAVKGNNFMQTICAICGNAMDLQKSIACHNECCYQAKANLREPQWLPVSQCDLKPGEAFWVYEEGHQDPQYMVCFVKDIKFCHLGKGTTITHYLRALPPYAIPKPPVVEVETDSEMAVIWSAMNYPGKFEDFERGWNACAKRASLRSKGGSK